VTVSAPAARLNEPPRAIACMTAACLFLAANDAAAKWSTQSLPIGEVIFIRGVFAVALIAIYAWLGPGARALKVRNWRGQSIRGGAMVAATFLFVSSLTLLPLPTVISFMFTVPIFTALSVPALLGESVGVRRWAAIAVGFLGVIVLVRPTGAGLGWIALLPLACAALSGFRDAFTRRLSDTETPLAILLFSTALETASGMATLPFAWRMPDLETVAVLALAAVLFVLAQFFTIDAFRRAEAATVAPFRYTLLLWAALWGYLIWGDVPDEWTVGGAAIVMACGLYILFYESRRARSS
jgi:drug/metabolite transporter (DMT)-like permease